MSTDAHTDPPSLRLRLRESPQSPQAQDPEYPEAERRQEVSRRSTDLAMVAKRLELCAKVVDERVGLMRDHHAGHPRAASYDAEAGAGAVGPHAPTDPTGNAATSGDPSAADMRLLDRAIRRMLVASDEVVSILSRYHQPTRQATPDDRDAVVRAEPGCELCAKVVPPGFPAKAKPGQGIPGWWAEIHRTTDFKGVLEPPLDSPVAVCSGHYMRVRRTGFVPSRTATARWRDTGRWPAVDSVT